MQKEFITNSYNETISLGQKLGTLLNSGDVLLLEADLAGGKTTFTKGIGLGLGVKKVINSPTFTIVKEYMGRVPLYHLDLYRLDGVNNDFDLEEYFDGDGVCVVEWPYQVSEVLPNNYLKINIEKIDENSRKIIIFATDLHYEEILKEL